MKLQEKARLAQIEREKEEARAVVAKLESSIVKIPAKAGAGGKLFGSVTAKEIAEALEKQYQIAIEKNKVVLAEPIKAFGTYEIKCKLGHEITGKINIVVTEEK